MALIVKTFIQWNLLWVTLPFSGQLPFMVIFYCQVLYLMFILCPTCLMWYMATTLWPETKEKIIYVWLPFLSPSSLSSWHIQTSLPEIAGWNWVTKPMKPRPLSKLSCLLHVEHPQELSLWMNSLNSTENVFHWKMSSSPSLCWAYFLNVNWLSRYTWTHFPQCLHTHLSRYLYNMPAKWPAIETMRSPSKMACKVLYCIFNCIYWFKYLKSEVFYFIVIFHGHTMVN